jgi:hypothetical protein
MEIPRRARDEIFFNGGVSQPAIASSASDACAARSAFRLGNNTVTTSCAAAANTIAPNTHVSPCAIAPLATRRDSDRHPLIES